MNRAGRCVSDLSGPGSHPLASVAKCVVRFRKPVNGPNWRKRRQFAFNPLTLTRFSIGIVNSGDRRERGRHIKSRVLRLSEVRLLRL